jgi:hypothetical protein
MNTSKSTPATWKAVYTVIERGDRSHWLRVGTAFVNRDGSLNVKLDALPVNGTLQVRDADPKEIDSPESVPRPVPHANATPERVGEPR